MVSRGLYQAVPSREVEPGGEEEDGLRHGLTVEDMAERDRRSRFMWIALVAMGMGLLGMMAVGVIVSPSQAVRQVTTNLMARPAPSLKHAAAAKSNRMHHTSSGRRTKGSSSSSTSSSASSPSSSTTSSSIEYTEAALADEITSLPGLTDELSFRHFSGYLPITDSKNIFYWYTESEKDPATDPLVFWTNGGPGCSAFLGFFTEMGSFAVQPDGYTVKLNPYMWNTIANMLYVEVPVGVGFSYTTNSSELTIGDKQTAADNYLVIQTFLERFPHLRSVEFYLTAESYGGHYIPTLAMEIIGQNNLGVEPSINFMGFAVGNPYTDPVENTIGMFDTLWGHQLIPQDLYTSWKIECAYSTTLDAYYTDRCLEFEDEMWMLIGDLNPYALDYPVCMLDDDEDSSSSSSSSGRRLRVGQRERLVTHLMSKLAPHRLTHPGWSKRPRSFGYDPCTTDYATTYLNREDVKLAIHADTSITWEECSETLDYEWADEEVYMEPIYSYLVDEYKQLRILVYSGDDDSVCATRGTQLWIDGMAWTSETDWEAWIVEDQVAGYIKNYVNNFTFATVHGAGHEVPTYKPVQALELFRMFIQNEL